MDRRCRYMVIAAGAAALCLGCVRQPRGVLGEKEMASLTADLELAEAYLNTRPSTTDAERRALADSIITAHGLTRAEFDSTMSWYGRNMDAYADMTLKAEAELRRRQRRADGKPAAADTPGKGDGSAADLWQGPRLAYVTPLSGGDQYTFDIPAGAGQAVRPGARLRLNIHLNRPEEGVATFGVEYDDGRFEYLNRKLTSSRSLEFTLQTDSTATVARVFGNLQLAAPFKTPLWIDSIYITPLPLDANEYYIRHGQHVYCPHPGAQPDSLRQRASNPNASVDKSDAGIDKPSAGDGGSESDRFKKAALNRRGGA